MKPKPSTLFTNKFSGCLSKLRDTSTIEIGHQLFRQLLMGTQLKDIIGPFTSKLDTVDRPTEREKKEHAKLYISLVDHYGEEILLQQFYEKFMQSLAKKTVGVADVIGYLSKGYISRIHPLQNQKNYIIYILTLFKNNTQIHKIIKQLAQNISPIIISQLQSQMISNLIDKMQISRQKHQYIEAMMGILLALEDRFTSENMVQPILAKNLKNQDWNVRKACVDMCYTFMVVKEQINSSLHQLVKELKYDKIKNVRDSVLNYESLYKQVYGQEESFKPQIYSQKTQRVSQRNAKSPPLKNLEKIKSQEQLKTSIVKTPGKVRNETFFRNAKNSDVIRVSDDFSQNISELNIKSNKSQMHLQNDDQDHQDVSLRRNKSFQMSSSSNNAKKTGAMTKFLADQANTVKRQKSPKNTSPKLHLNLQAIKTQQYDGINTFGQNKKTLGDLNRFGKKQLKILPYDIEDDINKNLNSSLESQENQRRQYMPIKRGQLKAYDEKNDQPSMMKKKQIKTVIDQNTYFLPKNESSGPSTPSLGQDLIPKPFSNQNMSTEKTSLNNNHSIESGDHSYLRLQMSQIKAMFQKFEQKVITRLDKLQSRIQSLEQSHLKLSFGKEIPLSENKNQQLQNLQDSAISIKNDHYYPYEQTNFTKKPKNKIQSQIQENSWILYNQNQSQQALESNLLQKVNEALRNHNIDEAFSVALANNKISLLMKLLQSLHIPTDKTVEQCLLLEVKKQVGRKQALKWLKNYLIEKMSTIKRSPGGPVQKMLIKIRSQLMKQNRPKEKDYDLLKTIVLNEMEDIFKNN